MWETGEALQAYLEGPNVKSLPERSQLREDPKIEIVDIQYALHS